MKTGVQTAIDRVTNKPVTVLEKRDGGLFIIQFVDKKGEIANALAGQKALRRGSELQREETQENPLQTMKEIHREFDVGMRDLAWTLRDLGIRPDASYYSGYSASVDDLGRGKLAKVYHKILGTNRYDGLIKEPSNINREHKQAYRELHGLGEEDEIIHFNKQAAASFVQMIKDLPDLAATRFIQAFYDLARNGWIREGGSYSNQSIGGSNEFEIGALLFADVMTRSRPQRDDTTAIRSDFLRSIGMGGSRNDVPSGALRIGQQREKKVGDMIIGEEGYTTPWSLDRISRDFELSCTGGGTCSVKLRKTATNELTIVGAAQDDPEFGYRGRDTVPVGQVIRIS